MSLIAARARSVPFFLRRHISRCFMHGEQQEVEGIENSDQPNDDDKNKNKTKKKKKDDWKVISTAVDSVYTISQLSPNFNYEVFTGEASKLFRQSSRHVSPKELNYELPCDNVPEFAFVGRSNVGKSSLINFLLGNNKIVRISKTPGCTRNVNFYSFVTQKGVKSTYLVDLPGYGFAKTSKRERDDWKNMIKNYLGARDLCTLPRAYILVDARRGASEADGEMMEYMTKAAIPHQVILTKADLVSELDLRQSLNKTFNEVMKKNRHSCLPIVHVTSSKTGHGMLPFMQSIAELKIAGE